MFVNGSRGLQCEALWWEAIVRIGTSPRYQFLYIFDNILNQFVQAKSCPRGFQLAERSIEWALGVETPCLVSPQGGWSLKGDAEKQPA